MGFKFVENSAHFHCVTMITSVTSVPWLNYPLDLQFRGYNLPAYWCLITDWHIFFPHLCLHHPLHPLVQRSQRSSSHHHLFTNCILWIVTLWYCMNINFARCEFRKCCEWVQVCKIKMQTFQVHGICYCCYSIAFILLYSVQWQFSVSVWYIILFCDPYMEY